MSHHPHASRVRTSPGSASQPPYALPPVARVIHAPVATVVRESPLPASLSIDQGDYSRWARAIAHTVPGHCMTDTTMLQEWICGTAGKFIRSRGHERLTAAQLLAEGVLQQAVDEWIREEDEGSANRATLDLTDRLRFAEHPAMAWALGA